MATVTDLTGSQITTTDNLVSQDTEGTNLNRFNFGELILNDIILTAKWLSAYVSGQDGSSLTISDDTGSNMTITDNTSASISVIDISGS